MSSVWYLGPGERRISAAEWTRVLGAGSWTDIAWNIYNGYSVPSTALSIQQLTLLAQNTTEFKVNAPDGKRGSAAVAAAVLPKWAPKPVVISDNCYGSAYGVDAAASTAGTGERYFNIGINAVNIFAQWNHWYTERQSPSSRNDTDPAGPITFSASLRIVSSSNPNAVLNTLYRLTFKGRTTVTLDPGGSIECDSLGISLNAGDVIAVRTYLSSGTAYALNKTLGASSGVYAPIPGGFVASADLTAPGSAAIPGSTGYYFSPAIILGSVSDIDRGKSIFIIGDSIAHGGGDIFPFNTPTLQPGFLSRALTGKAGFLNVAIGGDAAQWFKNTSGSFRRIPQATKAHTAIIEYGTNDFQAGVLAATHEVNMLNFAKVVRQLGISKVFFTTILPLTTSTDNWATLGNQTPGPGEPQRILYNTWLRANCPIDPNTLQPVLPGTPGALTAGSFGHPVTGFFEIANICESGFNSGLWKLPTRVIPCSMTAGDFHLNLTSDTFNPAMHEQGGDIGLAFFLNGAGPSGAVLEGDITAYSFSTRVSTNVVASTTVTNSTLVLGPATIEGVHPTSRMSNLMVQAIDLSRLAA